MTLIATFLVIVSTIGWASLLSNTNTISLPKAVFTVAAAMGCLMMMAFILNIPGYSARILIYGGWVALLCTLLMKGSAGGVKELFRQYRSVLLVISMVMMIIGLMAWGLEFSSIDDYSFWGTISRFLFVFNHLPQNADYIKASFLQYTPGLACFHYLFYQFAGFYSPMLNYMAQDLILLAPLLLFLDGKHTLRSLVVIMAVIILLFFAYGNILAKLEVDATIALWFFALLWTAIRTPRPPFWVMLFGLIFLSIVKEIGLLFAIVVIGVHYICNRKSSRQLILSVLLLSGVFLMKTLWLYHVHQYGFASFAARITPSKALFSLIPGHPDYAKSQLLFLKGLLFSNFDHLIRIPFVVVFVLAGWQIYRLSQMQRLKQNTATLIKAFYILLPIYIINLYWLQAIVFRVGYEQTQLLDFPRYFNMAFVPFILSVLLISLQTTSILHQQNVKRWVTSLSLVALAFMVGGKLERMKKYYHPYDYTRLASIIQKQTADMEQDKPFCLAHVPNPDYQILMPLQFRLMPRQIINIGNKREVDCEQILDFSSIK